MVVLPRGSNLNQFDCLLRSYELILTPVRLAASKLGFLAAIALLLAMPVMACLVPTEEMTAAERDCCRQTAGDCANAMPGMQSHSCCAKTPNPEVFNIAVSSARVTASYSTVLDHIALPQGLELNDAILSSARWSFETHSPPLTEPPYFTTVLRI